jgi:hypothetical protein
MQEGVEHSRLTCPHLQVYASHTLHGQHGQAVEGTRHTPVDKGKSTHA